MSEFVVDGLLIAPLVKYALLALAVFLPVRLILLALSFHKWFWHPLLAEAAIYTCILSALNIFL